MDVFKTFLVYFSWLLIEGVSLYVFVKEKVILLTGNITGGLVVLFLMNLGFFALLTARVKNLLVFPYPFDSDYVNIYIPSALLILCSFLELFYLKSPGDLFLGFTLDKIILFVFGIAVLMGLRGTRGWGEYKRV